MARHVGLRAQYQEVDIPPYWDMQGDTMVLNRHINIYVRTPAGAGGGGYASQIVDFNAIDIREDYPTRRISDRRAEAHFYSNRGVDYLQAGEYPMALAHFRRAIEADRSFADTWINLGALYSRVDRLDYAEQAYLRALQQKTSMIGLSNLASLYERQGRAVLAADYRARVAQFRNRNPYYRYHTAQQLIRDGKFDGAITEIREAIRLKADEDSFHFLLGVAQLQLGQREAALAAFGQAQQLAEDAVDRRRYSNKIDRLLADPETAAL
jgi:Flp pilus assembly protein TadD